MLTFPRSVSFLRPLCDQVVVIEAPRYARYILFLSHAVEREFWFRDQVVLIEAPRYALYILFLSPAVEIPICGDTQAPP